MPPIRVLFVCLGNICRSPVAEAMFRARAAEADLDVHVESAGTQDYHVGEEPQPGSQKVATAAGLDMARKRARQIETEDFRRFTHIIALDEDNMDVLRQRAPEDSTATVQRLMFYSDRSEEHVLDPYGLDDAAFQTMFEQLESGITGLVADLKQAH